MRATRIVLIVVGVLVALLVALLLLAGALFDPNDHKGRLETAFREATGRALQLEGPLELSLFPWLAVETGRATVANRAGFGATPFAALGRARLGVRLWPLLSARRLEFGTVRVDGLEVNLAVARDGTDNWSDLLEHLERRRADDPAAGAPAGTTDFSVARVELRDAALRHVDARTGRASAIEDWDLAAGPWRARTAADLRTSLAWVRDGAQAGTLELRTRATSTPAELVFASTEGTLALVRAGRDPLPVELRAPQATLTKATRALALPALALRVGPAELEASLAVEPGASGYGARGRLALAETDPRALLEALAVTPPATRDAKALTRLGATANFTWSGAAGLQLEAVDARLDETRLAGRLALERFAPVAARFELRGDALDLDRYLPPLLAPDAKPPLPPPAPPPGPRSAADVRGAVAFDRLVVAGVTLERVEATLRVAGGRLAFAPLRARAFGGSATTELEYDFGAAEPTLRLDQRLEDVDVGALLRETVDVGQLEGRGGGRFTLTSRGHDGAALFANLAGPYEITVAKGAVLGVDLWHEIERAVAAARLEAAAVSGQGSGRTPFERLTARGTLRERVLVNDRLEFDSDVARVTGRGRVDYGRGALDLDLEAQLLRAPEGRVFGVDLGKARGARVPLRVTGRPADPKVRPDVSKLLESAARDAVREPVERRIREELEKIFR